MSKRQVIILWAIALVLVSALVAVKSSHKDSFQSATERSRGQTLLADFQPDQVTSLSIANADGSSTLIKKDGAWTVGDRENYPADTNNINELLRKLAEVTITQGIEADPALAPRFGMDPKADTSEEQGTLVALADESGTELVKLTFGRALQSSNNPMSPYGGGGSTGRFIRNHADPSGVYVTSELFPNLNSDPKNWFNQDFLRIDKIESISLSELGKPDSILWTLTRPDEAADFTLEGKKDNEILDPNALTPLKSIFSYARFEDVVPSSEAAEIWPDETKQKAIIKTLEGFTYNITLGPAKTETPVDGESIPERFLMTVEANATIPAERKKSADESEQQSKERDEAFASRKAELEKRLATTKTLEGHRYQVSRFTIDALLKDRIGLIQSAPPAAAPTGLPPGFPANLPGAGRPIQAVTPPVAVPPRQDGE